MRTSPTSRLLWLLLASLPVAGACVPDPVVPTFQVEPVGPPLTGLRVAGNRIVTGDGSPVTLRGVNRSGTEYACVQSFGIFDGPSSLASLVPIAAWRANAVRIPLNESCWLGINGVTSDHGGDVYRQAIRAYVEAVHQWHMVPILELHWVGPGTSPAERLQPMPGDHSADFWRDVANAYRDDDGVIFELFNEPYPDGNRDTDAGWQCWRDGCVAAQSPTSSGLTYQATGMQALVDVVRSTGATNVILVGGLQFSNALTQWLAYRPVDPTGNLGAVWHVYNFNGCRTAACWDQAPAAVAAAVPLVATEIGQDDCAGTFVEPLMQWLDARDSGYLAWSWNARAGGAPCVPADRSVRPILPGDPWMLVTDYVSGHPNSGLGQAFRDHFQSF